MGVGEQVIVEKGRGILKFLREVLKLTSFVKYFNNRKHKDSIFSWVVRGRLAGLGSKKNKLR